MSDVMARFPTSVDNGNVPYRLSLVESELVKFEQRAEKVSAAVNELTIAVGKLSDRIGDHDERRSFWNKVAVSVVAAAVLAVVAFLLRLSYIVQMARSP